MSTPSMNYISFRCVICPQLTSEVYDSKLQLLERRILLIILAAHKDDTIGYVDARFRCNVTKLNFNRPDHMMLVYWDFTWPDTVPLIWLLDTAHLDELVHEFKPYDTTVLGPVPEPVCSMV